MKLFLAEALRPALSLSSARYFTFYSILTKMNRDTLLPLDPFVPSFIPHANPVHTRSPANQSASAHHSFHFAAFTYWKLMTNSYRNKVMRRVESNVAKRFENSGIFDSRYIRNFSTVIGLSYRELSERIWEEWQKVWKTMKGSSVLRKSNGNVKWRWYTKTFIASTLNNEKFLIVWANVTKLNPLAFL